MGANYSFEVKNIFQAIVTSLIQALTSLDKIKKRLDKFEKPNAELFKHPVVCVHFETK